MPKKSARKVSKKEESDDDYEVEDNDIEDVEETDVEEFDEEENENESDEEKDELLIDQDTEKEGCVIDEILEDEEEFIDNEETELPVENSSEYVTKEYRVSSNRLTKYEMVRILGERTKQLTMGAKPLIKKYQGLSYDKVAEEEFRHNMIPYKIKRPLPNGKFEIWTLDELYKDHLLSQLE